MPNQPLQSSRTNKRTGLILLAALFSLILEGCQPGRIQVDPPPTITPPPVQSELTPQTDPAVQESAPTLPAEPVSPDPDPVPIAGIEINTGAHPTAQSLGFQSGAAWLRRNALRWPVVEPERGQRLWNTELDNELIAAAENGLEVILIVRDTPPWAQQHEGIACGPIKESEFEAFANFLQDAVTRYSQPPFNVKYWELGNEPDVVVNNLGFPFGCWGIPDDPYYGGGYYGRMLQAVYPVIKAADPNAQVLIGGLLLDCNPGVPDACADPRPLTFLEGILAEGYAPYFDGVSFHAYDYYEGALGQYGNQRWISKWNTTGPVVTAKVAFLRSLLSKYGVYDKYLINSESAMINTTGKPCDAVCEESKAIYAVQSMTAAVAQDLRANIWYSLQGWRDSGLIGPSPDFQALPAYQAFRFASEKLSTAQFIQNNPNYPGVVIYEMQRGTARFWVVWSLDGAEHGITLPQASVAVWDLYGSPVSIPGTEVTVSVRPLYIEW